MAIYLNNNGAVYKSSALSGDFYDISFFAWIKIDTNDQYHQIFANGHSGSFGQGYAFYLTDNGDGNVLGLDIAYQAALESALTITDNNWHDVVIDWNAMTKLITVSFDGTVIYTLNRDIVTLDFASNPIVKFGFTRICLENIYGTVTKKNTTSSKVLLKNGFKLKSSFGNTEMYEISKNEWNE